jgi:hypothetical protein
MKRMLLLECLLVASAAVAQETWTCEKPYVWARDKEAITMAREGAVFVVTHAGKRDWALGGFPRIAVKAGDVMELVCKVKAVASAEWANVETGVVLRDAAGKELEWSYGGASAAAPCEWTVLKSRFIVPKGAASVEPRLIGNGALSVWADGYVAARAGTIQDRVNPQMKSPQKFAQGNLTLSGDFAAGTIDITDARTGRVWHQDLAGQGWMVLNAEPLASAPQAGVTLTLLNPETTREIRATLTLTPGCELAVSIDGEGDLTKPLDFPPPFETRKGDRLIVPMNEGMSYPVDEEHQGLHRMIAYGGHGLCMGFFGVTEDATGAGWLCLLETPDDAAMNARRGAGGLWQAGPSWDAQKGQFGYTRKARYVFFDKGGHVALCKRYREHAKRMGLYKPFTEKVKRNPNIDLLIGAANIWRMGSGKQSAAELVKEMRGLGMQRILWSAGGSAEQIKSLRALPDVLVGRYDIYQDIMDPANFDKIRYKHGDWVTEAFPQDINWRGPNGDLRRGWEIEKKDGAGMIPCAVICDAKALPYARKRISEELKVKPYSARFIDTTVAAPWFECYHPDHPMTRSQSRQHKMELLNLIGEFGLVCGSETGHEASVPFCDYFEGMLSVGPYRVPDSGRDMLRIWDEVPATLAKYQVGEAYRLPLWELVYHDCVVAQWYWGDYNNKLPKVWRKRDLFNALYGTPPMYLFDGKQWDEKKAEFAASYKVAQPVSRATGYSEMTDHRLLTADRRVQQSVFANGVTVTVNFGDEPYKTADGQTVPTMDLMIKY